MLDFLTAGGPFMFLLVLTSLVALTFIIERGWALRWDQVIPPDLTEAVAQCRTMKDLPDLDLACEEYRSPLGRLLTVISRPDPTTREEVCDALETRARQEVVRLERWLLVLEVVVGVAPLLGLLGTIHGLITLFADLGSATLENNAVLAKGISFALNTTMAGLLISIPSLTAWSFYNRKVETLAVEMETICSELVHRLYRA